MHAARTSYTVLALLILCPLLSVVLFGPQGTWAGAVGSAIGGLVGWSIVACWNGRRCLQ